jgi:hypoxanthine-guanine phosphoribosyltransferase
MTCYLTCIFFDTQTPKQRSIEILIENETAEQINNKTAKHVSERNKYVRKCQQNNFLVSVVRGSPLFN